MASAQQQLVAITEQLDRLLQFMVENHIVDARFVEALALQDNNIPNYISEVLHLYFESSNSVLNTIRGLLLVPEVEFVRIAHLGNDLKRGSVSLGALLVVISCDMVLETCRKQDKEECAAATHSALVALQSFETRARLCLQLQIMKRFISDSGSAHALEY